MAKILTFRERVPNYGTGWDKFYPPLNPIANQAIQLLARFPLAQCQNCGAPVKRTDSSCRYCGADYPRLGK